MSKLLPWLAAALCSALLTSVELYRCQAAPPRSVERRIEAALQGPTGMALLAPTELHRCQAAPPRSVERRIEQSLESPTQMEFIETPLSDIVDFLKDFHGMEIQINAKALGESGIEAETLVNANLRGITIRSALNLMLPELNLTYVVQDEVLLITTPEDAQSRLSTRVYPADDCKTLINVITTTIAPETWRDSGGPGSIAASTSHNVTALVVSQSYHVHRKIAQLLDELPRPPEVKPQVVGTSAAEQRIEHALASPTQFEFIDMPLSEVVDYLKQHHGIEIQIDTKALDDVGLGSDTPITKFLKGISLRSALRLMLRDVDLTSIIEDEVLLITTPEEAGSRLSTTIYPVNDLLSAANQTPDFPSDGETLLGVITATVWPCTWDEVGGPGSICGASFGGADVLVISQTQEVHEEIADLLEVLRVTAGIKQPSQQAAPAKPAGPPPAKPAKSAPKKPPKKQPAQNTADPFGTTEEDPFGETSDNPFAE